MTMKHSFLTLHLVLAAASPAFAADTPEQGATLQLGSISVTGEKVVATLREIKAALKRPLSGEAEHANEVVCRIEKQMGEAREYLDCATNMDFGRRRDATRTSIMAGTWGVPGGSNPLDYYVAAQPDRHLRVPVNGGALQALLARLPDAPEAETRPKPVAVPAAATRAGTEGKEPYTEL
jgi:hypothetical protein